MNKAVPLVYVLLLLAFPVRSQKTRSDSLSAVIANGRSDSSMVNALNAMAELKRNSNPDTCIYFAKVALVLADKIHYLPGQASANLWIGTANTNLGNYDEALEKLKDAQVLSRQVLVQRPGNKTYEGLLARILNNTGNVHWRRGNYREALANTYASLAIRIRLGNKQGMADSYNNMGNIHLDMGNYPDALKNHFAALKLREEFNNPAAITDSYIGLGNVYYKQSNYKLAEEYYLRSLKIKEQQNDQRGMSMVYSNLSNVYSYQDRLPEAMNYIQKALAINEALGDKGRIALNHTNIATLYYSKGDAARALVHHFISLKIKEEIGDPEGYITSLNNIGLIYVGQKRSQDAMRYFKRSLEIGRGLGSKEDLMVTYNGIYQVDSITGNSKGMLSNFKLYIQYRDSLFNEENTRKQVRSEMNYEFDKKEAASRLEQEKKDVIAMSEKRRQRIILMAISGFGLLVLLFAIFAYRSFLQKRKANIEITRQKHLIEEKQKEILDSIRYAKRIQSSLMPREKYIEQALRVLK